MLDRAARRVYDTDFVRTGETPLNDLDLIVRSAVENALQLHLCISPGQPHALELLKEGFFHPPQAGYLGLGQKIPADCSVDVFCLTDLDRALQRWGDTRLSGGPNWRRGCHRRRTSVAAYAEVLAHWGSLFLMMM